MTRVSLNEETTAAMPENKQASKSVPNDGDTAYVTDSKGRRLKLVEPDILSESRLVRSLGEAGGNVAYMYSYVIPAAMVTEIDGEAVPFPMGEREVDAAIQLIGRHGLAAINQHLVAKLESAAKEKKGNTLKK